MLPKVLFWHLDSAPSPIFQEAIWKCDIGMLVGALWQHRLVGFTVLGTVGVVVSIQGLSERLTSGQSWFWSGWPGISRKLELQILNLQQAPGLQLINQGNLSERDCKLNDPMVPGLLRTCGRDKKKQAGIYGLRLPVQMCMLPLGIFKGLQIKNGVELCTNLWKAVFSSSYHLLDMNMLLPMQLCILCQGWLV